MALVSASFASSVPRGIIVQVDIKVALSKAPAVTFGFWLIKTLAMTLGDTTPNATTLWLSGYLIGTEVLDGAPISWTWGRILSLLGKHPSRARARQGGRRRRWSRADLEDNEAACALIVRRSSRQVFDRVNTLRSRSIPPLDTLLALYGRWIDRYTIESIEDGFGETDWPGFTARPENRVTVSRL